MADANNSNGFTGGLCLVFQMTPGGSYSLRVGDGGETLNGLSAPECTDSNGNTFSGGLYLVFGK